MKTWAATRFLLKRDTAQVIWGLDVLAQRSVGGKLAPNKRRSESVAFRQLTPAKVDVVYGQDLTLKQQHTVPSDLVPNENVFAILYLSACLEPWATLHNVDVAVLQNSVPRILTSKIEDVKKKLEVYSAAPSAATPTASTEPSSPLPPSTTPYTQMGAQ